MEKNTKTIKITDLKHPAYNPREIKREDIDALKRSIERFGLRGLITVNTSKGRDGFIIGGNMTVMALKELGWETIPKENVDLVDMPEKEEKALSLALNKIAQRRDWNDERLAELMVELNHSDFDLTLTGFNEVEISNLLDSQMLEEPDEEDKTAEEEYEEIKKPVSKYGEVYKLGRHRLMCGDATKIEDIKKLLGTTKVDMVFTDPPYNVAHVSHEKRGKFPTEQGKILGDQQSQEDFEAFSEKVFANYHEILKPGATMYVCTGYTSYPLWYYEMLNAGFEFSSTIVWVKPSFAIGWGDYKKQYEQVMKAKRSKSKTKAQPLMYGWKKGERHFFYGDNNESDVWDMPRKAITKMAHPTEKPEWLIMRAIKNSSRVGQVVVDFFGGSGSTLFAANKLERTCYLLELDPRWCDVIRNRWEKVKVKG
ncbi:MAG: DNA modification methylase [Candidatus Komeilibacteria bacterium CG10_big_fil_rev_8_21_14_0_10_36_65]|nr:MAG: DNA modification methylase [Candidatus Komeilibacteria bacterium CG10_big_fil_rev_8_21_14_0_10_36_65]